MKKLIAFILCAVTVVFLAGCIKNEPVEKTPEEKTETRNIKSRSARTLPRPKNTPPKNCSIL